MQLKCRHHSGGPRSQGSWQVPTGTGGSWGQDTVAVMDERMVLSRWTGQAGPDGWGGKDGNRQGWRGWLGRDHSPLTGMGSQQRQR